MKIIFSRKGFDSTSGGAPSPIIDGVPYSLPIPTGKYPSETTYGKLGLGDKVSQANNNYTANCLCHDDPMFWEGKCAFGQKGGPQSHLAKHGVREGDVFLFFGLFAELGSNDRHHRIFGYLKVENVRKAGSNPKGDEAGNTPRKHPHTIGIWDSKNTIYLGRGAKSNRDDADLRLSKPGGPLTHWRVPDWLQETGLTYHRRNERWIEKDTLHVVGRGQEFVTDIGDLPEPKKWLERRLAVIDENQ